MTSKFIEFVEKELHSAYFLTKHFQKYETNINQTEFNINVFLNNIEKIKRLDGFLICCFTFYYSNYVGQDLKKECINKLNIKSHDYSEKDNRYSNFQSSANYIVKMGIVETVNPEISLNILIGVKIARLKELLTSGKVPKNESITDSLIDLINYRLLLEGYRLGLQ